MVLSFRKQLHRSPSILMSYLEMGPSILMSYLEMGPSILMSSLKMAPFFLQPSCSASKWLVLQALRRCEGKLFDPNFTRKFDDPSSMVLVKSSLSSENEAACFVF